MNIKPLLQAVWLADEVRKDESTGKVTVTGIFDQIFATPHSAHFEGAAYLFFTLRGIRGKTELVLRYVDLGNNNVLLEQPISVASADPLATTDVTVRASRIPVPHAGRYAWEVWWHDEVIGCSCVTADIL